MKPNPKDMEEILSRYLPLPSQEDTESDCNRVLRQLQSRVAAGVQQEDIVDFKHAPVSLWRRVAIVSAAAAMVLVAVILSALLWPRNAAAVVERVDGGLNRVVSGETEVLRIGQTVEMDETIRSNGGSGGTLKLADGSRVEMRSKSELFLERADDGVRIRLRNGGIIVNAARQRTGHLYVQTKDVTVSVVGTVFLVNAEEEGSRVAVIEGEVHVQQGATEKKLRPGEQVTTNPRMESLAVKEEISWSREAASHAALLQQAAPKEERMAFEVASIRPSAPFVSGMPGGRGGTGGGRGDGSANFRPNDGCVPASTQQLDPRRLAITRATLFQLIAYAYPFQGTSRPGSFLGCGYVGKVGFLAGGSDWVRTEMWDLEASIPQGFFSTAPVPNDPKVQQMLQTLLADRFKLAVRRETRQIPVYLLKVGKDGPRFNGTGEDYKRMTFLDSDGKPKPASEFPPSPDGMYSIIGNRFLDALNVSMASFAQHLSGIDNRPVFDRTGLTGRYDFHYYLEVSLPMTGLGDGLATLQRDAARAIGLELEESKAPFEVWVIERAEKPSEN